MDGLDLTEDPHCDSDAEGDLEPSSSWHNYDPLGQQHLYSEGAIGQPARSGSYRHQASSGRPDAAQQRQFAASSRASIQDVQIGPEYAGFPDEPDQLSQWFQFPECSDQSLDGPSLYPSHPDPNLQGDANRYPDAEAYLNGDEPSLFSSQPDHVPQGGIIQCPEDRVSYPSSNGQPWTTQDRKAEDRKTSMGGRLTSDNGPESLTGASVYSLQPSNRPRGRRKYNETEKKAVALTREHGACVLCRRRKSKCIPLEETRPEDRCCVSCEKRKITCFAFKGPLVNLIPVDDGIWRPKCQSIRASEEICTIREVQRFKIILGVMVQPAAFSLDLIDQVINFSGEDQDHGLCIHEMDKFMGLIARNACLDMTISHFKSGKPEVVETAKQLVGYYILLSQLPQMLFRGLAQHEDNRLSKRVALSLFAFAMDGTIVLLKRVISEIDHLLFPTPMNSKPEHYAMLALGIAVAVMEQLAKLDTGALPPHLSKILRQLSSAISPCADKFRKLGLNAWSHNLEIKSIHGGFNYLKEHVLLDISGLRLVVSYESSSTPVMLAVARSKEPHSQPLFYAFKGQDAVLYNPRPRGSSASQFGAGGAHPYTYSPTLPDFATNTYRDTVPEISDTTRSTDRGSLDESLPRRPNSPPSTPFSKRSERK